MMMVMMMIFFLIWCEPQLAIIYVFLCLCGFGHVDDHDATMSALGSLVLNVGNNYRPTGAKAIKCPYGIDFLHDKTID